MSIDFQTQFPLAMISSYTNKVSSYTLYKLFRQKPQKRIECYSQPQIEGRKHVQHLIHIVYFIHQIPSSSSPSALSSACRVALAFVHILYARIYLYSIVRLSAICCRILNAGRGEANIYIDNDTAATAYICPLNTCFNRNIIQTH